MPTPASKLARHMATSSWRRPSSDSARTSREAGFISIPMRAVVKALKKAVPPLVVKFVLDEIAVRVLRDRASPERLRGGVERHLTDFPPAAELIEDVVRTLGADPCSPILLHDEELPHPVLVLRQRHVGIHQA